jgi:hypothetical protein
MSIILNGNGTSNFSSNIANDGTVAFGSSAFNLDSSGNVGIGLTNPSGMIEVQKSGVPAIISNYANQKHIQMGSGGSGAGFHVTDGNFFTINHQPYTDRGTDNNLTERFRVTTDGNVNITDGNLVVASGHGIDFSATSDGSGTSTSELLDDYEEGTWTPIWTGNGASIGSGTYTRVGRMVTLHASIAMPGTSNTAIQVLGGLPFTSPSNSTFAGYSNETSNATYPGFVFRYSGTQYFTVRSASAQNTDLTRVQTSGISATICIQYTTDD